jgi:hypothetical protein
MQVVIIVHIQPVCTHTIFPTDDHGVVSADLQVHITSFDFVHRTVGQWLDYLHVKLWSVMNFHSASGDENFRKLCIFMLGCDS